MLSLRHHLLTTLIFLCLPSLLAAQEEFRWRSEIAPDAAPAAAYGGANSEDFLAILYCSSDPDGSPFITAEVVVETEGYAEGARALLEFYGPRWTASLPVTINGPGLYPTVSARITFSEEDTIYRSMFNNVDQALYR